MADPGPGSTLAVLITYHNERALLQDCLESLRSGPETTDEVIVYDDASTYPAEDYLADRFRRRPSCSKWRVTT